VTTRMRRPPATSRQGGRGLRQGRGGRGAPCGRHWWRMSRERKRRRGEKVGTTMWGRAYDADAGGGRMAR
jgi:hypothetical protein